MAAEDPESSSYDNGASYFSPPPPLLPPAHAQSYHPCSSAPPPPPYPQHLQTGSSSDSPYKSHQLQGSAYHRSHRGVPTHSDAHSSSFESQGSSNTGGVPPYVGYAHNDPQQSGHHRVWPSYHHYPKMGPPPPGYHPGQFHSYPWPPPPMELISDICPADVLSGRGGATNSHSGNRAFRAMVKQYQGEYLKAKKRDKPSVAAEVVKRIRQKGGRFLRRYDFPNPHVTRGEVLYYDIGDRRATEKACQALREGAPVLRAKRRGKDVQSTASSEEEEKSAQTSEGKENKTLSVQTNDNPGEKEKTSVIRPSARLLRRTEVQPISLDMLTTGERDMYLDFLPPDSTIRKSEGQPKQTLQAHENNVDKGHPVVSV